MLKITDNKQPMLVYFRNRTEYYLEPIEVHEEHEINLVISGAGVYHFEDHEDIQVVAGDIVLLTAGEKHALEVPTALNIAIIHFHPSEYLSLAGGNDAPLLKSLSSLKDPLPSCKRIAAMSFGLLMTIAEEMIVEQNQNFPICHAMLQAIARQTAILFLRLMQLEDVLTARDETTQRVLTVRHWLDRHFSEPCSLDSLSEMAQLAPTYFSTRFKELVNVSPMRYVRDRRIGQAKLLLKQTRQPVKLIAANTGFSNVNRFNRLFKQLTGRTPLEFRDKQ